MRDGMAVATPWDPPAEIDSGLYAGHHLDFWHQLAPPFDGSDGPDRPDREPFANPLAEATPGVWRLPFNDA